MIPKLIQNGSNWFKLVQTGSKRRKLVIRWYRKKGLDKHVLNGNLLTWSWQTWSWQTWSCKHGLDMVFTNMVLSNMVLTNMVLTWSWHGLYKHGLNKLFFWHGLDKHGHKGDCSQFGIDFQSCFACLHSFYFFSFKIFTMSLEFLIHYFSK